MNAVYLSSSGDTTTQLPIPLEIQGYGFGVIEMTGKFIIVKKNLYIYVVIFVKNLLLGIIKCQFFAE